MVTAPMLTQGVRVDLPNVDANPTKSDGDEPLVVTVDSEGSFFLNLGGEQDQALDPELLMIRIAAIIRLHPKKPVYIRGDQNVVYARVVEAMALIQKAGVPSVGLLTKPIEDGNAGKS
jgi:biopolymer transport protein TolR